MTNIARNKMCMSLKDVAIFGAKDKFLGCQEIVVLRRWERETWKFGFIKLTTW